MRRRSPGASLASMSARPRSVAAARRPPVLRGARAVAALIVAATGCGPARPAATRAPVEPSLHVAPPPSPAPERPRPHADYLALRPLRSYYRLVRVGPFAHHFRAWFHGAETVHVVYEIAADAPDDPRRTSDSFGLFTTPGVEHVPRAQEAMAEAIRRDIARRNPGASSIVIDYLGEYRELDVEEVLARPSRTTAGFTLEATLAANADLTRITGPAMSGRNGGGGLWLERGPVDPARAIAPVWIDALPDRPGTGRLWRMLEGSGDPAARDALYAAALAAARRQRDGAPPLALGDLRVQQDPRALPAGVDDGVRFVCYAHRRRSHETLSSSVKATLGPGGEAEASISAGGSAATCQGRLELAEPIADGVQEVVLSFRWSIRLGAEHRAGTSRVRARALVASGAVAVLEILAYERGDGEVLETVVDGDTIELHVGLGHDAH